jgi:hypothetical protein
LARDRQEKKQRLHIISTEAGRQIAVNDEHPQKADSSIRISLASNLRLVSELQKWKLEEQRIFTHAGMQIILGAEQEQQGLLSIRPSLEFASNMRLDSEWQEKNNFPR